MPSSRSEMSAGVIDGRIYVPGGWGNGFSQSTALEMYDPATDSWTRLADLPFHVNHHATAVYQNALYVFGPEDTALRYDPASDAWTERAPMPENRYAAAAAALGNYLYVIGGSGSTSDLLRYDPAADSWARLAPLLQAREHTQAVALDGQLYALGGRWERGLPIAVIDGTLYLLGGSGLAGDVSNRGGCTGIPWQTDRIPARSYKHILS